MNLRIAENIRRLRQEQELTQSQLAERLGVSYQAVSRWENETTYPDIELLPTIAALFEITVDELLGGTVESRQEALHRDWDKLHATTDPRKRVALLRQMRREHPKDWYLAVRLCAEVPSVEEKRRITEEILRDSDVPYLRFLAIRQMIRGEDEERVMELLWDYNLPETCWDEMLEDRYRARGEVEAYSARRQAVLLESLRKAMVRMTVSGTDCIPENPMENEEGARTILRVISAITEKPPVAARPVAGEGEPDLWASVRAWAGITLSCALSARGETEEALTVLEDAARLVTEFRALPPDAPLSYGTCHLSAYETTRGARGALFYDPEHMEAQFSHPAFAPLREDPATAPRFDACREVFVAKE